MGTDDSKKGHETNPPNLPATGKGVFVMHEGRHRMAYQDGQGEWRDYYNGEVLRGEVIYQPYD